MVRAWITVAIWFSESLLENSQMQVRVETESAGAADRKYEPNRHHHVADLRRLAACNQWPAAHAGRDPPLNQRLDPGPGDRPTSPGVRRGELATGFHCGEHAIRDPAERHVRGS
jgi:hypothetical protein